MNLVYNEMWDVEADRHSDRLPDFVSFGEFVPSGKQKSIVDKVNDVVIIL